MAFIKFNKDVSIASIIGWIIMVGTFIWVMAIEVSAAQNRIEVNEKFLKEHKTLIDKLSDKYQNHQDDIIELKSKNESQQEQLKLIKEDTKYLRDKIDKLLDKISK